MPKGVYIRKVRPVIERLMEQVEMIPECGCWIWMGKCVNSGYGQTSVYYKKITVHRLSWEIHNGTIPGGLFVCHICDNKLCINPNHLFLGTHTDNMADAKKKKRMTGNPKAKGVENIKAKLTEQNVHEIRRSEKSAKQLSEQYHVSPEHIRLIKRKLSWSHV